MLTYDKITEIYKRHERRLSELVYEPYGITDVDVEPFARAIEKAVRDERCKWSLDFDFGRYRIPECDNSQGVHIALFDINKDATHCRFCGRKIEVW